MQDESIRPRSGRLILTGARVDIAIGSSSLSARWLITDWERPPQACRVGATAMPVVSRMLAASQTLMAGSPTHMAGSRTRRCDPVLGMVQGWAAGSSAAPTSVCDRRSSSGRAVVVITTADPCSGATSEPARSGGSSGR